MNRLRPAAIPRTPVIAAASHVWPLLLGVALLMLGNGLQGTLLGVRATLEGFGSAVTGVVMSGYFLGFLAGSLLAPGAVGRVGHLRVFAALTAFASVAILVQSVFVEATLWTLMRIVTGFSYAGIYIVTESWLNDRVTNEHRGGLLSVYMIVAYFGMGGGQLLLNLADPGRADLFILISVLVSLASVPILLVVGEQPEHRNPARVTLPELFRISRLGTIGVFTTGIAQGALFGMGAVYGSAIGLSVAGVSVFMMTIIAGGALAQWPVGKLSDRLDRRRVIVWLAFVGAVAASVAPFVQRSSFAGLLAIGAMLGASSLTLYSLFNAHTNDRLHQEQRVAASSGLILIFGLGAILGPPLCGWLMGTLGASGFLIMEAAVHAAIWGFALVRRLQGPAIAVGEQTHHVAVAARTPLLTAAMVPDIDELGEAADAQAGEAGPSRQAGPGT